MVNSRKKVMLLGNFIWVLFLINVSAYAATLIMAFHYNHDQLNSFELIATVAAGFTVF